MDSQLNSATPESKPWLHHWKKRIYITDPYWLGLKNPFDLVKKHISFLFFLTIFLIV